MIQYIIAGIIIAASAFLAVRYIVRSARSAKKGGCSHCASCPQESSCEDREDVN